MVANYFIRPFARFWLTTLLPLALALPTLLTLEWQLHVSGFPLGESDTVQRGFPLPAVTDSLATSAASEIFVLPLLFNWAFSSLCVTALGRWWWPRMSVGQQNGLLGAAWLLFLLALPLAAVVFAMGYWSLVSPYPVLEIKGIRPYFLLW